MQHHKTDEVSRARRFEDFEDSLKASKTLWWLHEGFPLTVPPWTRFGVVTYRYIWSRCLATAPRSIPRLISNEPRPAYSVRNNFYYVFIPLSPLPCHDCEQQSEYHVFPHDYSPIPFRSIKAPALNQTLSLIPE